MGQQYTGCTHVTRSEKNPYLEIKFIDFFDFFLDFDCEQNFFLIPFAMSKNIVMMEIANTLQIITTGRKFPDTGYGQFLRGQIPVSTNQTHLRIN